MVAIAICLAGFSVSNVLAQDNTKDQGVIINGVKWATRNVDKPGIFAVKPESSGMFYQWNSKIGWSATDPLKDSNGETSWKRAGIIGPSWNKGSDPSPSGWRIPTLDEIKTLLDTNKVSNEWLTVNGVTGSRFTDKVTGKSIFLPAVGYRSISDGELRRVGLTGFYWSSNPSDTWSQSHWYGSHFVFGDGGASTSTEHVGYAHNVRSVAE